MGKNKKTRWRTFSFNGSKEDETHIIDGKLNDIDTKYSSSSETPHKYSQILGDHQTNYISSLSNRTTSSIHNSKTRNSYNNKENYYNQRSAAKNTLSSKATFGSQRSHKFPINASLKDNKKPDNENGSSENVAKIETVKFNEDEYTRITTPRQDVLFKKGYLSRMNTNNNNNNSNNNKTVSPTTDSTAPNSSITTNSDQESNVSTLSPATTPSMEYGQVDGMEYATPLYYPGYYYDENGILVIPMYNGYNYYSNGSSATSPVYLMPYPYQYDPFFMAPNTEVRSDVPCSSTTEKSEQQDEENGESTEKSESVKTTNDSTAEEQNGARMSSEDATTNGSSQREETESDEKSVKQEQTENEQSSKQTFSFYPNEFGYMYPTYSNGFYNGLYYYSNGMPSNRPSKLRRRKRFLSSRNSHPRSTETTTDYSDDDVGHNTYTNYKPRYNPRHHNGWMYHNNNHHHHHHYNNYNQYHYNSKYNRMNVDKNANETKLNVDVPEFYPCVSSKSEEEDVKQEQESKRDVPVNNDLQNQNNVPKTNKCEMPMKINNKASHTPKPSNAARPLTKKDIIEGIKSMEQQNINLISTSKSQINNNNNSAKGDDEWNVIRNGKKIKILKDTDDKVMESNNAEENIESCNKKIIQKATIVEDIKPVLPVEKLTNVKKTSQIQQQKPATPQTTNNQQQKSRKSKGKNKKKKNNHFMGKQDGFEIIEPEFGNNSDDSTNNKKSEDVINETTEEDADEMNEDLLINNECEEISNDEVITEKCNENVVNLEECIEEVKEEEIILKVLNVQAATASNLHENDNDVVIDISDEDICSRSSIEISIAQEIAAEITEKVDAAECTQNVEKTESAVDVFNDINFFDNNHKNIAELERDLMENLKILDDGIDIKSPIINPLYDFPITSAVQKWLNEKQNESFDSLFRIENFKKLSELYDDCENDDVDDDKSDISDSSPFKSDTTDSDYASDIQVNKGSPASSNAKITSKSNNKILVKESFCALM